MDDLTLPVTHPWMDTQFYGITPKIMDIFGGWAWWNTTGQLEWAFQEYLLPAPHFYLHA